MHMVPTMLKEQRPSQNTLLPPLPQESKLSRAEGVRVARALTLGQNP